MRIGSLFSGIGGLDLAVEAVTGGCVAWHCETDPYAAHVLARHWPAVPNLGDITRVVDPPPVDALCGGFPCQDVSDAGKREGIGGRRSGLWHEYARLLGVLRPAIAFVENVSGLRTRGLDEVLGSLAGLGFDAEWLCLRASDVGAPHRRRRLFLLAWRERDAIGLLQQRQQRLATELGGAFARHDREPMADADGERGTTDAALRRGADARGPSLDVANTVHDGRRGGGEADDDDGRDARWGHAHGRDAGVRFPPGPSELDAWARWTFAGGPLPGVRRGSHGTTARMVGARRRGRLRCLGNGVVPRQAAAAFLMLIERAAATLGGEGTK